MPGIEFNANVLAALRNGELVESLPAAKSIAVSILIVLIVLVAFIFVDSRFALVITIASLFGKRDVYEIAAELGDSGGGGLKKLVTEAVNEGLAGHRARRAELLADLPHLRGLLTEGNARANAVADATLAEVRTAMQMVY